MGQKALRRVLNTVGAFGLNKILAKLLLANNSGASLLANTCFSLSQQLSLLPILELF